MREPPDGVVAECPHSERSVDVVTTLRLWPQHRFYFLPALLGNPSGPPLPQPCRGNKAAYASDHFLEQISQLKKKTKTLRHPFLIRLLSHFFPCGMFITSRFSGICCIYRGPNSPKISQALGCCTWLPPALNSSFTIPSWQTLGAELRVTEILWNLISYLK